MNATIESAGSGARYALWEHGQSGEVFAVRMNETGRLTGCWGPLLSSQVVSLDCARVPYDEDPKDLVWIEEHRENWALSDLQSPPHY